ncbi:Transcription initiation factor TFIID subunit 8 [Lucilia cuprina]|uniref:Transcription initiation factor TFIID subunit 8 n=1 Tax=Lucilia cuprina TaxID=7375 RepID=A0A0L0BUE7_LUCCU|nr:transcription initiation factor TFIID subunit 8 [Lucilia cuprina]KAI8122840.1 Transcription initiation factor TFIID subunit 8 [Lucilia cuprina]KNC23695.1 Transcription initiation factor TFIID subunit 8 [Lucilia cuprina]
MDKTETVQPNGNARRKILSVAVSQILMEKGFDSVDKECLETLTEMLQSMLVEVGQSARSYCELSGRTIPVIGDVIVSLVNMGVSLQGIEAFAKREGRQIISMPAQQQQQKQLNLLQAGTKSQHPPHILPYLPLFPDPHAYVRTPTHKQPVTEYEAIREKAATQKRDIEKALTKFLAKTSETHSLFDTEDNMFPLIACKPSFPPYLAALNPTDQVFDFEELEYHYLVANRTEDCKDDEENESGNEEESAGNEGGGGNNGSGGASAEESEKKSEKTDKDTKPDNDIKPNSSTNKAILENPNIDNPYLRAATLPKRAKPDPILLATAPTASTNNV